MIRGLQGPQGPIGPRGFNGVTGPTGTRGDTGPVGIQGTIGPTGATGPQGETGLQGPQGIQGPTGPRGETGLQGPTGLQGLIGPIGPQGEMGPTGPQGIQGEVGPTGPQGIQGEMGPTGPPGLIEEVNQYPGSVSIIPSNPLIPFSTESGPVPIVYPNLEYGSGYINSSSYIAPEDGLYLVDVKVDVFSSSSGIESIVTLHINLPARFGLREYRIFYPEDLNSSLTIMASLQVALLSSEQISTSISASIIGESPETRDFYVSNVSTFQVVRIGPLP